MGIIIRNKFALLQAESIELSQMLKIRLWLKQWNHTWNIQ